MSAQIKEKSRKDYQITYTNIWLTHKQRETHAWKLSIIFTDVWTPDHQYQQGNSAD